MAQCKQCERSEFYDLKGRRTTRVNKSGLCPMCVEVFAEMRADRMEAQRRVRADRMEVQRRVQRMLGARA